MNVCTKVVDVFNNETLVNKINGKAYVHNK